MLDKLIIPLSGLGILLFLGKKSSKSSASKSSGTSTNKFIPPESGARWDLLDKLGSHAESFTGIDYLRDFLIAAAWGESKGNPSAINYNDGPYALDLLCNYKWNYDGRFKDNPWLPKPCKTGSNAKLWKYSGGWLQLMPVSALSTRDGKAKNNNPTSVFFPPEHVAYAVDYIVDLVIDYGAQTFGDARAGMLAPKYANPNNQSSKKQKNQNDFLKAIKSTENMGVDQNLFYKKININNYSGYYSLSKHLNNIYNNL